MDELNTWKKAAKIAGEALEFGAGLIKENVLLIDVTKKIEDFILSKNAKAGFPVQISINSIAAHYTSYPGDETRFKVGDLVKLDLGAHIDGYIGDTAKTIEIKTNNNKDLIKASEEALNAAIETVKPGVQLKKIGKVVNDVIESYGFVSIKNLSGHTVERYSLHAGLSIPNYDNGDNTTLKENQVIAIEPFASTGSGFIKEGKPSTNYRLVRLKNVRDSSTREVLGYITEEIKTIPFSKRQLCEKFSPFKVNLALRNLEKEGLIDCYPQLPEKKDGSFVSQKEHTILVKEEPIILTKV